ncbi:unnamed protein product [Brugia pahangi]|uniref:Transposase n=1 Tax=Brugia pahangi TaxID=6280 RepID=A0A0N4TKK1_BRUPA|nr:unnamed protein product [Brugia pahangi]
MRESVEISRESRRKVEIFPNKSKRYEWHKVLSSDRCNVPYFTGGSIVIGFCFASVNEKKTFAHIKKFFAVLGEDR